MGAKSGLRCEMPGGGSTRFQVYAEGGFYIGGQYSFRRDEWRLNGYFCASGVAEWRLSEKHKFSRRLEYRYGSSVDF
jgi:hypothetical protein